jgi:hypothetical protein
MLASQLRDLNARASKQANFCGGIAALGNKYSHVVPRAAPEHHTAT